MVYHDNDGMVYHDNDSMVYHDNVGIYSNPTTPRIVGLDIINEANTTNRITMKIMI